MEQSLQKALVQQIFFLQFWQYQLLNYLYLIYICGPVICIVLCDGDSSLVFYFQQLGSPIIQLPKKCIRQLQVYHQKMHLFSSLCSLVFFLVNAFFQSIIVQYSSICISVNVRGEQRWSVPLCPKMTVCELYRGEQVGASKNY